VNFVREKCNPKQKQKKYQPRSHVNFVLKNDALKDAPKYALKDAARDAPKCAPRDAGEAAKVRA
jgi:hypothetical protein